MELSYTREQILKMMSSDDANDRAVALTIAGFIEYIDLEVDSEIIDLLDDPSLQVRWCAVNVLVCRGLLEAIPDLSKGMLHHNDRFRLANANAMKGLLESAADHQLQEHIHSNVPWIAYLACLVLWERGERGIKLKNKLERLSNHPDIVSATRVPSTEIAECWKGVLWDSNIV